MNNKILVTGAEGFIGSHLTEYLVKEGYEVKAFVLYNSFNSWGWLDNVSNEIKSELEVFTGDIRNFDSVKKAIVDCKTVFHLGALIAIPYSYISPSSYIDTNISGTVNILQAALDHSIDHFIHTSTSEVYGSAQYVPIDESHPLVGQSPYSASKISADQLAYSFFASFDLPVSIARPFNTFGPRQSARAIIPTIISQIAGGSSELKLGSLEPTRDFNYVEDTVNGFVSFLNNKNTFGEAINIGSGHEISIGRLVELISEIMQAKIKIIPDNSRLRPANSEVERLLACNKKAKKLLNWSPKYRGYEGLKAALELTINWFKDPNNLKHYKHDIYNQ